MVENASGIKLCVWNCLVSTWKSCKPFAPVMCVCPFKQPETFH